MDERSIKNALRAHECINNQKGEEEEESDEEDSLKMLVPYTHQNTK